MANAIRYWVPGGSGIWAILAQGGNANNWAETTGGTPGASIPAATDIAIFDGNSGSGEVQLVGTPSAVQIRSIIATNFEGEFTGTGLLQITGSNTLPTTQNSGITVDFGTEMDWNFVGNITLSSGNGSGSINYAGKNQEGEILVNGSIGIWTLTGDISAIEIKINAGTFNTNGYTVNVVRFAISGVGSLFKSLNLGSSIINCSGDTTPWAVPTGTLNFSLNAGTSTIRYTDQTNATPLVFLGGSRNYHTFEVARGSSNTAAVQFQSTSAGQGSNVFFNFIDKSSLLAHDINFLEGSPQTFQNFNVRGASGTERIRFVAETVGTTTSLVKIGVGGDNLAIVICDYLDLGDDVTSVTPLRTWYAGYNSIGTGDGWILGYPRGLLSLGVGG
jgi:hypothetical protein